jgi:hypothetical protein
MHASTSHLLARVFPMKYKFSQMQFTAVLPRNERAHRGKPNKIKNVSLSKFAREKW